MDILITILITFLVELVLHYFPWRLLLKRELPKLAAYALGVLGLMLPYSGLLALRGEWSSLLAVWAVILAGGLAVLLANTLDRYLLTLRKLSETEEREQALYAANDRLRGK